MLEMCQDRYDHWFFDAIAHPNYDRTLMDVHRLLDVGKGEGLADYKGLDLSKSTSHIEFLVGLDQCSYRSMPNPCQTVFGDRSIKITNKRYKSKLKMLDVYKDAIDQYQGEVVTVAGGGSSSKSAEAKKPSSTIFDLKSDPTSVDKPEEGSGGDSSTSDQIVKLRQALKELSAYT